jgi:uncharacterized iron-regulated membrane protein
MARPAGTRSRTFYVRKAHRWLGLVIGIQFFLWTAGGLYFAWTNLSNIHGDHLAAPQPQIPIDAAMVSPGAALAAVTAGEPADSVRRLELVRLIDRPVYRITYTRTGPEGSETVTRLADARSGEALEAIGQEAAVEMATRRFAHGHEAGIADVRLLREGDVGAHSEIRGFTLPAWRIAFDHPSGATAYVAAETGEMLRIRNTQWRVFDFFWMLHTMDYRGRDDFNNWLLRFMSVFAMVTILAGFVLFVGTSRPYRRWKGRRGREGG